MRAFTLAIVVILRGALPTVAQEVTSAPQPDGSARGVVGSIGIGAGPLGLAGELSLGEATSVGDVFIRVAGLTDVDTNLNPAARSGVHDSSMDVAVLLGHRLILGRSVWLRVAAGPGFVRTVGDWRECLGPDDCLTREERKANSLGLAAQMDGTWLTSRLGVGLGVFGNRNRDRSFWGVTFAVHFGAVR